MVYPDILEIWIIPRTLQGWKRVLSGRMLPCQITMQLLMIKIKPLDVANALQTVQEYHNIHIGFL
jgi:hypothetical protein